MHNIYQLPVIFFRSRRRNDSRNWRREREELNSVVKKLQKKNNKLLKRNKKLQEANQEAGTLKNVSKSSGQKGKGKPKIDRSVQGKILKSVWLFKGMKNNLSFL